MILITGSTGLLGSHVLYALLQEHASVAALKRSSTSTETLQEIFSFYTKTPDDLLARIDWRTGDMLDQESLYQALEGISCVVNCAAIVSFNPGDRKMLIANNVQGTRSLAEAVRRHKTGDRSDCHPRESGDGEIRVIHVSSTSALGDGPGNDPKFLIDENTPRNAKRVHTGYSESKLGSEEALREVGVNAVILNPGIILGPGQWGKGSSQLFEKAWQGLKYYPYGGTGYVDVRDIADLIVKICGQPTVDGFQERYCLVGANLRYREFFNLVTDEFGKPNPSVFAGRFLSGLAWRADTLRAKLTGGHPLLTRETAESAQRISFYSAEKARQSFHFEFRPVEETIDWVAGCFAKHP